MLLLRFADRRFARKPFAHERHLAEIAIAQHVRFFGTISVARSSPGTCSIFIVGPFGGSGFFGIGAAFA